MSLTPHDHVGPFEILALLGKGGMGEVYLAQDTRLRRKVALKVLPSHLTDDPERLRRFNQEAQAVSALNHPNIITIHEIGQVEGTCYIVTEFIEGLTLRQRLSGDGMKLHDAIDIAAQVASALAEAHKTGIVHRDIKPENVMLRSDGLVKVLDFGLAKLIEASSNAVDVSASTMAHVNTEPGRVFGTPWYMSPEQARGLRVDARSDIFSLGVMLYEMLAGRRPYEGKTSVEVIAAILHLEPPPLSGEEAEVPESLRGMLTKALQKDREHRYLTATDLELNLKKLKRQLETEREDSQQPGSHRVSYETVRVVTATPPEGSGPPAASSSGSVRSRIRQQKVKMGIAVAGIMIVAAALLLVYFTRRPVLTDKDTILVADFVNTTGDAVFDDTLKQAVAVQLEQSPFLNVFSSERAREVLRLMGRSPD
ncbi:MAG: serine/threonine-protein kinase, partial [Acidobacteriota bacterium]